MREHGHREEVHRLQQIHSIAHVNHRKEGEIIARRKTFCDCMATILNMSNTLESKGATLNSSAADRDGSSFPSGLGAGLSLPPLGATQNTFPPAVSNSPMA